MPTHWAKSIQAGYAGRNRALAGLRAYLALSGGGLFLQNVVLPFSPNPSDTTRREPTAHAPHTVPPALAQWLTRHTQAKQEIEQRQIDKTEALPKMGGVTLRYLVAEHPSP